MLEYFIIAVLFNILMFFPAFLFKTDKLTDISYSLSFLLIINMLYFRNMFLQNPVFLTVYIMVMIWALRLGGYLFYRIWIMKQDKRFQSMRTHFFKFFAFWLLQGTTVFIALIPAIFLLQQGFPPKFNWFSLVGIVVFIFGLLFETIADVQKFQFMQTKPKTFLQTGLWAKSRHPNYFGEICIWIGIYLFCIVYLTPIQKFAGLISPVFIYYLLRYVSGVPLLEKSSEKKYGHLKKYQTYVKNTPVLFPKI